MIKGAFDMTKEDMDLLRGIMREELGGLETRFDRLEADVGELKTTVTGMQSDIREMQADISGMKSDIREMQADIGGMKSDIREMQADIGGMKSDIRGLTGRVDRLEMKFDEMQESIAQIREDTAITRAAVNVLGEWAENAAVVIGVEYPVRRAR